jgi:hypothetical protein
MDGAVMTEEKRFVGFLSDAIPKEMFKLYCKEKECIIPFPKDCRWCEHMIKEKV